VATQPLGELPRVARPDGDVMAAGRESGGQLLRDHARPQHPDVHAPDGSTSPAPVFSASTSTASAAVASWMPSPIELKNVISSCAFLPGTAPTNTSPIETTSSSATAPRATAPMIEPAW